ncbi:MAG TPA: hypothetical protein VF493_04150 [Terriglobales bacterium]
MQTHLAKSHEQRATFPMLMTYLSLSFSAKPITLNWSIRIARRACNLRDGVSARARVWTGRSVKDDPKAVRSEVDRLVYPAWEVEYRLKVHSGT